MENKQISTSVTESSEQVTSLVVQEGIIEGEVSIARSESNNEQLVRLFLHGRPETTQRAYARVLSSFFSFIHDTSLDAVTLDELQSYVDSLAGLKLSSIKLHIMAIKSLYTFAMKKGAIRFNIASLLTAPKFKDEIASRILSQEDVIRMVALTSNKRDHAMLRLMYMTGIRVSEVAGLSWKDVSKRADGAQLTIFGKGSETRYVLISQSMLDELKSLGEQSGAIFKSRKGATALETRAITRIVAEAAKRAGIDENVSAHWLRHANASHALDNGATIAVVQESLGHKNLATTSRYTHARPNDGTSRYIRI